MKLFITSTKVDENNCCWLPCQGINRVVQGPKRCISSIFVLKSLFFFAPLPYFLINALTGCGAWRSPPWWPRQPPSPSTGPWASCCPWRPSRRWSHRRDHRLHVSTIELSQQQRQQQQQRFFSKQNSRNMVPNQNPIGSHPTVEKSSDRSTACLGCMKIKYEA